MRVAVTRMARLEAPVPLALHGPVALSVLSLGFFLAGAFVVAESKPGKSIVVSFLLALMSSAALGVGVVFLLAWMGVFV